MHIVPAYPSREGDEEKMKYTQKDLFDFMESGKKVTVVSADGASYTGKLFAYSSGTNLEEFGVDEPSIEVCDTMLYLSEIEKIEYAD